MACEGITQEGKDKGVLNETPSNRRQLPTYELSWAERNVIL